MRTNDNVIINNTKKNCIYLYVYCIFIIFINYMCIYTRMLVRIFTTYYVRYIYGGHSEASEFRCHSISMPIFSFTYFARLNFNYYFYLLYIYTYIINNNNNNRIV